MSFSNQQGIMEMSEHLISHVWRSTVQPDFPREPFPVITYNEAMEQYGTDKPDTRFKMTVSYNW